MGDDSRARLARPPSQWDINELSSWLEGHLYDPDYRKLCRLIKLERRAAEAATIERCHELNILPSERLSGPMLKGFNHGIVRYRAALRAMGVK